MNFEYKDFDLIEKFLSPIEVVFIILYSHAKDKKLVDFEMIEGKKEYGWVDIEEQEDSGNFMWQASPYDKEGDDTASVAIEFAYSGGWYGGSSGSYWDPPEAPTTVLSSLEIETFQVYDPKEEDWIDLDDKIVDKAHFGFTYQNMLDLATTIGLNSVSHEELRDDHAESCMYRVIGRRAFQDRKYLGHGKEPVIKFIPAIPGLEFPLKLKQKLQEIQKDKSVVVKGTTRKYGL
jgi:hypothetical protein